MFKYTVSQHSSPSLPGSNTGIQYKSCVNVIKCRLIASMLLFLKAFKVVCTAGRNLSALNGHAQWRQQLTCLSLLITDCSGESTSNSARQAAQVGGIPLKNSNVPPLLMTGHWSGTNKRLIWNPTGGWATGRVWWSEVEREYETERERRKRDGARVSERELLFPPNPSYWILAVGIHHSPPLCYSGIGCKTLIKAHLPTTHRHTVRRGRLCDSKMRNFSRSINFVVDI